MEARKDYPQAAGAFDGLGQLQVQLALEDSAWSMVVVESVPRWDRDSESVGRDEEGLRQGVLWRAVEEMK